MATIYGHTESMQSKDNYANGATRSYADSAAPASPSPFNVISNTFEETQKLAYRVEALVNRLCGSIPEPVASEKRGLGTDGILDEYQSQARQTLDRVSVAHEALARIEGMLP